MVALKPQHSNFFVAATLEPTMVSPRRVPVVSTESAITATPTSLPTI